MIMQRQAVYKRMYYLSIIFVKVRQSKTRLHFFVVVRFKKISFCLTLFKLVNLINKNVTYYYQFK